MPFGKIIRPCLPSTASVLPSRYPPCAPPSPALCMRRHVFILMHVTSSLTRSSKHTHTRAHTYIHIHTYVHPLHVSLRRDSTLSEKCHSRLRRFATYITGYSAFRIATMDVFVGTEYPTVVLSKLSRYHIARRYLNRVKTLGEREFAKKRYT